MKQYLIYKIISPSNKVYIGQTSQLLHERKAQHKYIGNKINRPLYNAARKYGWKNMTFQKVLITDKNNIDYYEQKLIEFYKGKNLSLNLESGGCLLKNHSKETKDIMSKHHANFKGCNHPRWIATAKRSPKTGRIFRRYEKKGLFKKPVIVINNNGEIKNYLSAIDAAKDLNLNPSTVYAAIYRFTTTRQGLRIKYLNGEIN